VIGAIVLAALTAAGQFAQLPLSQALESAVRISPDVAQARAHVEENVALLQAARAGASPSLQAGYTAAPQGGNANNTIEQSLVSFGGALMLNDYFAYAPAVREAQFTLAAAQYGLYDAQRSEREKTLSLYYAALKAMATSELRSQDFQGAQSDLRAAQLRYRAGDAPRLDVVRAQVALADARAALDAAHVDVMNAQDALAAETGAPPQALDRLVATPFAPPAALDPQQAVARAFAQRSDLRSAREAVNGEQAAVAAMQRGVLPAVALSAGWTHGYDSGVLVSGPSANVTLNLPLSHAAGDRVAAERARLSQAEDKAAALQRQIAVSVAAVARSYNETMRAVQSARTARVAAQAELRATEIGYRSGASSSLDVADARRTYVQAALDEVNAVYAQAQTAATLQEEMGP
jgi:outer membrane protein TolC